MRQYVAALTLLFGLSAANPAHAGGTWGQDLRFVAETQIPGNESNMALCHLVDYLNVLFVPVYTTIEGYALSNDGCTGDMYRELSSEDLVTLQGAGLIPSDVPATPQADLQAWLWGHAWLILGGVGLAFRGLAALRGGRSRKAPTPDALAIHSLVAMSQVAVADGRIDDAEVRQISAILTRLTGRGYSMEQVAELLARLNPSAADLAQVGQDLSAKDRQIILEAALNIAVADGEIHPSEYAVVSDLAQRMQIGADEFRHAMARISQHLGASQPA